MDFSRYDSQSAFGCYSLYLSKTQACVCTGINLSYRRSSNRTGLHTSVLPLSSFRRLSQVAKKILFRVVYCKLLGIFKKKSIRSENVMFIFNRGIM